MVCKLCWVQNYLCCKCVHLLYLEQNDCKFIVFNVTLGTQGNILLLWVAAREIVLVSISGYIDVNIMPCLWDNFSCQTNVPRDWGHHKFRVYKNVVVNQMTGWESHKFVGNNMLTFFPMIFCNPGSEEIFFPPWKHVIVMPNSVNDS
jgi:hypothetical protein